MNGSHILERYRELQRYIGWHDQDAIRVRHLWPLLQPRVPLLIEAFLEQLRRNEATSRVLVGGPAQTQQLYDSVHQWLEQLFTGPYDERYASSRWQVGRRHVELGLDQAYTNVAVARLRSSLIGETCRQAPGDREQLTLTLESLNRLLDLDLLVMGDAYETEQVQRQRVAERQRSEDIFRNLVEAADCPIVILRGDRTIAYFSPFAEQLTGYEAAAVQGRDYCALLVPESQQQDAAHYFQRAFHGAAVRDYQSEIILRDGSRRCLIWNARRMDYYEQDPVVLLVGHDITSLREAQETALQSERLATIGRMSTGLAHESRNALQRIQAYAEMLELEVGDNPDAMGLVQRIQKAQEHVHRLLDEVRGFAGPLNLDLDDCPVARLWREAWTLLTPQHQGRRIRIRERLDTVDGHVTADHFRMVQVFRNLLENSLAACEDPVEIELHCCDARLRSQAALRIHVRDNGPGLNAEQRRRVFEPFYTTKSKGTGLGMAIVHRTVTAHEGTIEVAAANGPGAEFIITLPRHRPGDRHLDELSPGVAVATES